MVFGWRNQSRCRRYWRAWAEIGLDSASASDTPRCLRNIAQGVLGQLLAQAPACMVQPPLHQPLANPQRRGGFGRRPAPDIAQDDNRTTLGRQPANQIQ